MKALTETRTIRQLMRQLRDQEISPRPEFQRKLVWSNKHKSEFINTVLSNYPLPEIFLTSKRIDPQTGEEAEMLVDGQQRLTTLFEYVTGHSDFKVSEGTPYFSELESGERDNFLEQPIVIRVLPEVDFDEIREIFTRINSTKYALNAMEINHARYDGELKRFAQNICESNFFAEHRVFSSSDIRRMNDLRYTLELIITMLSNYFNRDERVEEFLMIFNDDFEDAKQVNDRLVTIFEFIDACNFSIESRVWKKADLFTLIVELDRAIHMNGISLRPRLVSGKLAEFYREVDFKLEKSSSELSSIYHQASIQGTSSKSNRVKRAEIIRTVLGV
ncbi:DUF262 domain-containing protein [Vibrio parahaemolyticus]|uniref:DUF262 domain-containing protein n=1 Tax=Vibrio parahaemolyticus TaxID=670 RepID=UPI0005425F65|nr:DUF262 domain-containing protein [Vibrio parahaemolyticus]EHH1106527.1 DUF262 domain-containing protein [Vibrio parahaemolyticus]EHH1935458.1 DUF262 domain-containing protein [Vibrio parahaemolyticus]EIU6756919.1 DUF262 domain-containing protein [Vibrio parahaemolyticus]EIZ1043087.1 DUF262 domain-containing protein [Vibrio parahaemolyticus]ELA9196804.1 DUF262 domain-containing protein [Vibrio parahaemolyticus]